jgi:8-oxo-dGTP pyrophosphatase MutT (NUDIX family)
MREDEIARLRRALPLGDYGKGKAKSFQQLLVEIEAGETQIVWQDDRPIRFVRVVAVRVRHGGRTLVEDRQEFPDGRTRYRGYKELSEKLYPQEDHAEAVYRALQEELGLPADELKDVPVRFLGSEFKRRESPSYPGLESEYCWYKYEIEMPERLYKPEYIEFRGDGMCTYFVWE